MIALSILLVVPLVVAQALFPAYAPLAAVAAVSFVLFLTLWSRPMELQIKFDSEDPSTQAISQTEIVPYSLQSHPKERRLVLTDTLPAPSKGQIMLGLSKMALTTLATRLSHALGVRRLPKVLSLEEMSPPSTKAVLAATALCRKTAKEREWIYEHCMRTYLFGCAIAQQLGIAYDKEFLYVASLLHDLAFTEPYDRDDTTFELLSARAAKKFAQEQGMSARMQDVVHESIALHTSEQLQGDLDPETKLVSVGALVDISGVGLEEIASETKTAVVQAHPRLRFKHELCCLMGDHCTRKPWSLLAAMTKMGFLTAVKMAPFDE